MKFGAPSYYRSRRVERAREEAVQAPKAHPRPPRQDPEIRNVQSVTPKAKAVSPVKPACKPGLLLVGTRSDPNKVAGALAGTIRERGKARIQTIGAGALNQAVKAIAIARGFLAPSGIDLVCYPAFAEVKIDGAEKTALVLYCGPR